MKPLDPKRFELAVTSSALHRAKTAVVAQILADGLKVSAFTCGNYNNRMLVMYRPKLCENFAYPFMRFGNGVCNISSPILNILATILMATGPPIVVAGEKEFDASWLDVAANGLPKFDHYRCTYPALNIRPFTAWCFHPAGKFILDPWQHIECRDYIGRWPSD